MEMTSEILKGHTAPAPHADPAVPDVSVVAYVDENLESASQMYAYVANFLNKKGRSYEFIFMDDGTRESVAVQLQGLQQIVKNAKVIRLPRTYGPSTAMPVGFRHARGQWVLTLGPFLQVEPTELEKMFKKTEEGFDFINGWRQGRTDSHLNQAHTGFYNWLVAKVADVDLHDTNCTLKLFRRNLIDDVRIYGDLYRFLPVLAARQGYFVTEVPVQQRREINRHGFYTPFTYVRRIFDLVTLFFIARFITKPLRFFGLLGGIFFFTPGFLLNSYLVVRKYAFEEGLADRPLLLFGTLLIMVGMQIASVGLIGELILFFNSRQYSNHRIEKILD